MSTDLKKDLINYK